MKLFGWRRHKQQEEPSEKACCQDDTSKPDPDLEEARQRVERLERLADERFLSGLEFERDVQMRKS